MLVTARDPSDLDRLTRESRKARVAEQRDRFRVALLAIGGQETEAIMEKLGRSRGFVQRWAYAYRDGGIDALAVKKRGGKKPRMTRQEEGRFADRIRAGPTEADGVCTLRGKDAQRILQEELGMKFSLGGAIDLLHRLGFSYLRPRPRHKKNDPEAMNRWLIAAPLLSRR